MIKVNLKNGEVKVGGDFWKALEFVKAQTGRTYDSSTKTWTVPQTIEEFAARGKYRFPMDVKQDHVTKYGTRYTGEEWGAMKRSWKVESEIRSEHSDGIDMVKNQMKAELETLGVSERGANFIATNYYDLEMYEERGMIKFESPERRARVSAVIGKYEPRLLALMREEDEAVMNEQARIWEEGGIQ